MPPPTALPLAPDPASDAGRTAPIDPRAFDGTDVSALYVHVPFCFHKCHYCDFYSITAQTPARMSAFVDRVLSEADLWRPLRLNPRTVFFGGGTPSLLPPEGMRRLIAGLRERFDLSAVTEWTVEVNPATADAAYCRVMRDHGVDRLSFGAQSFDREALRRLERHHDPADVRRSVVLARDAGFRRVSLDLIFAIPGQTPALWRHSLDAAIALDPDHLSCYALTYEPNTPLAVLKRLGRVHAVEEAVEVTMLRQAREVCAEAGLGAYEVSNFARPGQASRHNLAYWRGENYVGLGPSAASHFDGVRWKNVPHLGRWEARIDARVLPTIDVERLSPRRRAGERAMLALRLAEGVRRDAFLCRRGPDVDHPLGHSFDDLFGEVVRRYVAAGLLIDDGSAVWLSDAGLLVADGLGSEFLGAAGE